MNPTIFSQNTVGRREYPSRFSCLRLNDRPRTLYFFSTIVVPNKTKGVSGNDRGVARRRLCVYLCVCTLYERAKRRTRVLLATTAAAAAAAFHGSARDQLLCRRRRRRHGEVVDKCDTRPSRRSKSIVACSVP